MSPYSEKSHVSVNGKIQLDKELVNMVEIAQKNREKVYLGVFVECKQRSELDLQDVYVTAQEREQKTAIGNLTKAKILRKCKDKIALIVDEVTKEALSERLSQLSKRVDSTSKTDILAFHDEVQEHLDCLNIDTDLLCEN